jgi:hypothetical protein
LVKQRLRGKRRIGGGVEIWRASRREAAGARVALREGDIIKRATDIYASGSDQLAATIDNKRCG